MDATLADTLRCLRVRSHSSPPKALCKPVSQRELSADDFERLNFIGSGTSSRVFCAKHRATGELVALKEISRKYIHQAKLEKVLKTEIDVQRSLRHPNVLRLYSYFVTSETATLVLEYCEGGPLSDHLKKVRKFDEVHVTKYLRQLCRALGYLHERGIIHRDLKLENVLLASDGSLRLADFGWSKPLGDAGRFTRCGTLDYLSPEMVSGTKHTTKTDVWSLGVMIVEMLGGKPPFYFDTSDATLKAICERPPVLPDDLPPLATDLIMSMLSKDPDMRPSVACILAHPWVMKNPLAKRIENGLCKCSH